MKRSPLLFDSLLTCFFVLLIGQNCLTQSKASEVYKKSAPTTVFIRTDKGGGTGFIVSSSGVIVTALHVVDGASKIGIKTFSGDVYDRVSLLAKDVRKDIAILKIAGFNLPSVELGNSDNLTPGDQLVVLGNPLAVEELRTSVSDGILSGIRDLGEGFKVLQITAPISPGNSGGAVFTSDGKAVGVVSFKLVKGEALNFAIPINYVRGLLESIDPAKPISNFEGPVGNEDLFTNKNVRNISGTWKANDGQILQIRDKGAQVVVLNLTYPEVNTDAQWIGDVVLGIIYNGGLFRRDKYYLMKLSDSGRLLFYFFGYKSKESPEQKSKRIEDALKNKPDFILLKID
jgi:S1-C subfamily serine protease